MINGRFDNLEAAFIVASRFFTGMKNKALV